VPPPMVAAASSTRTVAPACANRTAAARPLGPLPTTTAVATAGTLSPDPRYTPPGRIRPQVVVRSMLPVRWVAGRVIVPSIAPVARSVEGPRAKAADQVVSVS
jgi:hypothetical protein